MLETEGRCMAKKMEKLAEEIRELPDIEKLRLVDAILKDLDKPDPEIDRVWAVEARKRWTAYKAGRARTVSYESVMSKHRRS
jgi:putative addiction module component (TIGR02574 family)